VKKSYEVRVVIPCTIEKTIYIDDATSKTDARKKAKAWGKGEYDAFDFSGDENPEQDYSRLRIISTELYSLQAEGGAK
jgi:hypothetical protein